MTRSYFPRFRDYRGGTDADHVPVIPGNAYPPDTSSHDEFPLDLAAHGDADMGQPPIRPVVQVLKWARFYKVGLKPITLDRTSSVA